MAQAEVVYFYNGAFMGTYTHYCRAVVLAQFLQ